MPKTKAGEAISWKEFFSRWKTGIEGITPEQKIKAQLSGTRIQLLGILLGFAVSIYGYDKLWWVGIILLGAAINTFIQYLSFKQQLKVFDDIKVMMELPEEPEEESKKEKGGEEEQ